MGETKIGKVKAVRKDKKGFQMESGEWYGKSKEDLEIKKGDEVNVIFEVNGDWNNISKVNVLKEAEEKKEFTPGSFQDEKMTRMSALKSAVGFLKDKEGATIDSVVECAKVFEKYIN